MLNDWTPSGWAAVSLRTGKTALSTFSTNITCIRGNTMVKILYFCFITIICIIGLVGFYKSTMELDAVLKGKKERKGDS